MTVLDFAALVSDGEAVIWTEANRETYKADARRYPSELADAEWTTIEPLLSVDDPLTADLRGTVNACLYLDKTGCLWRYLPKDFGSWETVRTWHDRFRGMGSGRKSVAC